MLLPGRAFCALLCEIKRIAGGRWQGLGTWIAWLGERLCLWQSC